MSAAMFTGSASLTLAGALFALLLAVACVTDVRERRIPNSVIVALLVLGIGVSEVRAPGWPAVAGALGGVAVGLALWLPFWLLRVVGAGDVKLFAAASAWLGPLQAVEGALLTALFGGVVAILFMLRGRGVAFTLVRLAHAASQPQILRDGPETARSGRLPYALAIAAGVSTAAWWPGILL